MPSLKPLNEHVKIYLDTKERKEVSERDKKLPAWSRFPEQSKPGNNNKWPTNSVRTLQRHRERTLGSRASQSGEGCQKGQGHSALPRSIVVSGPVCPRLPRDRAKLVPWARGIHMVPSWIVSVPETPDLEL